MRNYIIIAFAIFFSWLSYGAFAGKPELPKDGMKTKITAHAPDARKDVTLTVNSQTVDMTNDISWSASGASDCSYRSMSTATKAGVQKPLYGGQWNTRAIGASSVHMNYSGCTGWVLERQ